MLARRLGPPQAPLGQLAALAPRRAAGAAGGQPVGGRTSPPETSLEPAAGAAGGQPAAGAGVFPFFPTQGVTRLVGKYPRGKMYQRPTNHPAGLHSPSDLSTDDPRDAR